MKLLALQCPNCGAHLKPANDDIVIACHNCYMPVAIAVNGPQRMKIWFATQDPDRDRPEQWVPFWVYEGQVHILQRETQSGWQTQDGDSEYLWGSPRQLFIPAWDLDLHTAQGIGSRLTVKQPDFDFIEQPPQYKLTPATVKPEDARKLLEFIILAIEARRKDWLKNLEFKLEMGSPQLWAMPTDDYR